MFFHIFAMPRLSGALFILCSILTPSLCCDWISGRFSHLSGHSLELIQNMGGPLTEQQSPVPFPNRLYSLVRKSKVESQLVFIRDSLDLMSRLYLDGSFASVSWDSKKLNDFQAIIHRQAEELSESCVSTSRINNKKLRNCSKTGMRPSLDRTVFPARQTRRKRTNLRRQLRAYYRKLGCFLGRSAGSAASWEIIRTETKHHLVNLHVLGNLIKAAGATSRGPSTTTLQKH